ncbi:MAG: aspartate aminotransferase family protein [Candidatus Aureabacteria bacterium]|nr:aspartate aminotransferase family protein [Candidatus Auribacterota bacterium]
MTEVKEKKLTSDEIKKLREEYLLPSTMTYFSKPVNIVRGVMQHVYDDAGKKYLDAFGAVVTISVGHCHPDIVPKVVEQIKTLQHMTTLYFHPTIAIYAEKLASVMPGKLKVSFFTNSGCEANELSAMLAKNFTKNQEFIALRHSFHGRTLMAMSLTGQSAWRHSLPYVFGVSHAPAGYCYRCPYRLTYPSCDLVCARQVEEIIKYSTSGKIAGFIAEPIQGFGGVICPPREYFKIIYEIVRRYGGICISDEVQTGFGRTGDKMWGIEQWECIPDVIAMAKGIGNGVPLGAVTTTREIAESMRGKVHFNTYGGNPVSMTQGLGVLEVIEKYHYAHNAKVMGDKLIEGLEELQEKHLLIGEVRGKGLMLGVELVKDRKTKEPAPQETLRLMDICKDMGLLVGKGAMAGNVIRVKPPLCIDSGDVDFILGTLDKALTMLAKGH